MHLLDGHPEPVRDPLTGVPLAFEEPDLAAAVAQLLADGGYLAVALVPAPPEAQPITSEDEALAVVRLLVAELRLLRNCAAASTSVN